MEPSQDDPAAAIRFRPSKKRKAYRQRADDSPPPTTPKDTRPPEQTSREQQASDAESAVTAAVRARNSRRARLRGVGFTSDDQHDAPAPTAPTDQERAPAKGIPDRFTHQTGLVATLNDRHMNEYIESRLSAHAAPGPSQPAAPEEASARPPAGAHAHRTHDQPTKHGKLLEVDVPADARRDARKRPPDSEPARPRRGRNRRGSDDMKRDQLVEAFLHENKLDVYDVPVQNSPVNGGDGRSADDRMADEFRQRYIEEVAARRLKRRPALTAKQQQQQQQQQQQADVLRGPKLGGSRNVRAAARDILLKQKQEREKQEKAGRRP
ncbi:hypothetical protein J3459_004014 [Metarhizium acridum]|nr:hypothetical protein J3459_004014 [Metarhizium acridum]